MNAVEKVFPSGLEHSMAFHSWTRSIRCNFLTATWYRKRIRAEIQWVREHEIALYVADYTTPFGLLALEELIKDRKKNGGIKICAYRTMLFGKRRTYRLWKEPELDVTLLCGQADYYYGTHPSDALAFLLPQIAIHCSETGRIVIEKRRGTRKMCGE